jgi:tetratricopeptide (TPR) repeat protein
MAFVRGVALATCFAFVLAPAALAQVMDVRPATPPVAAPSTDAVRAHQEAFESFRRQRLPPWNSRRVSSDSCDERIGRFCYWYDENEPDPPAEPAAITVARDKFIAILDSAASASPNDRWLSGQRVRYLVEAGRNDQAVTAARQCTAHEWWCAGIEGFALHAAGRFTDAERAFDRALSLMNPRERCDWTDLKYLLDDAILRRYRDLNCAARRPFEQQVWWLARPMLSSNGNDARTEYLSRLMMVHFLEDASSAYRNFDDAEKELVLRYGWPRAWSRSGSQPISVDVGAVVGHEPSPAHPYIPPPSVLENAAMSDSTEWRGKGRPSVRARFSPPLTPRLIPLEHQAALFRRGDSALVAVAWSIAGDTALSAGMNDSTGLTAALVLTKGHEEDAATVRSASRERVGRLSAGTPWGPLLMSVEVTAPSRRTLARARYGVRGSDVLGSRVQMSNLLLFEAGDEMPLDFESALAVMLPSQRIPAGSRVGVYWEAYNTNPAGEGIGVSITVAPEASEGGWLRRGLMALRLVREAKPVTMGLRDVSARGVSISPRAVIVDLSTLTPGRYLLELELDAGGGNVVRAEKAITITTR